MNIGTFAGYIGHDAELRYTKSGMAVADFSIAIDNGKDKDGNKLATTWVKAVLWDKKAEGLAQYIKKGSVAIVSGPVSVEKWINTNDNTAQAKLVVTVNQFTFGGKSGNSTEPAGEPTRRATQPPVQQETPASAPISDEDIPF